MNINITIMSGVEDGTDYTFEPSNHADEQSQFNIKIGRHDTNDLILQNDSFISRYHAELHYHSNQWWIKDLNSTNGTFIENNDQFFIDTRVYGTLLFNPNMLFRIGRTWLKIKPIE